MRNTRALLLCLIVFLLTVSVLAAEDAETQNNQGTEDTPELPVNPGESNSGRENVEEIAKQAGGAAIDATKQGLFGIGVNDSAITPIELPEEFAKPMSNFFRVDETLTLDLAIILICLFLISYIFVFQLVTVSGRSKDGWLGGHISPSIATLGAFVTSLVFAITGALYEAILFIRGFFDESLIPSVKIIFFILVVVFAVILIFWFITSILRAFKNADRIEGARETGERIGTIAKYIGKYKND